MCKFLFLTDDQTFFLETFCFSFLNIESLFKHCFTKIFHLTVPMFFFHYHMLFVFHGNAATLHTYTTVRLVTFFQLLLLHKSSFSLSTNNSDTLSRVVLFLKCSLNSSFLLGLTWVSICWRNITIELKYIFLVSSCTFLKVKNRPKLFAFKTHA